MSEIVDRIENIEWKVQKLSQKMKLLKKENGGLIEENVRLKNELNKIKQHKENLEANFNRTKEVLGDSKNNNTGSNKMLKEEIEHYVSEIDKCIEWLQSI